MPAKYPDELREPAIRLTLDARKNPATRGGGITRVAKQLGLNPETVHRWVQCAEKDQGLCPGTTSTNDSRIKELE